jgi:hypothetical protein
LDAGFNSDERIQAKRRAITRRFACVLGRRERKTELSCQEDCTDQKKIYEIFVIYDKKALIFSSILTTINKIILILR